MAIYKTREGQNIYDLSLQLYGTEDRIIDIFMDNPSFDSLNDEIQAGTLIEYTEEQNEVRQYLIDNKIEIATNCPLLSGAIGYDEGFDEGYN